MILVTHLNSGLFLMPFPEDCRVVPTTGAGACKTLHVGGQKENPAYRRVFYRPGPKATERGTVFLWLHYLVY